MARSSEPFWWLLFAIGGTLAAFFLPIQIVLTGIALPAGWIRAAFEYDRVVTLVAHPIIRLFLFAVIAFPLFHWAHRFRYTLSEGLALKRTRRLVAFICYGTAVVGTTVAAVTLARL